MKRFHELISESKFAFNKLLKAKSPMESKGALK
jgi:hypothetical protein